MSSQPSSGRPALSNVQTTSSGPESSKMILSIGSCSPDSIWIWAVNVIVSPFSGLILFTAKLRLKPWTGPVKTNNVITNPVNRSAKILLFAMYFKIIRTF